GIRIALPVTVVVENEGAPSLRGFFIVGLVPDFDVEPSLDAGGTEGRPQHIVVIEIHVSPAEAGVDRSEFLCFWIPHQQAARGLVDREQLCGRMIRTLTAP